MKPKNILLLALLTLTGCVSNNQNISNNEFGQSDNTNSTQSSISSSEEPYIFENPITDFAHEVEIDVWFIYENQESDIQSEIVKRFNKEYSNQIKVNATYVHDYDFYDKLEYFWKNDKSELPDACFMDSERIVEFASKGYLLNLDKHLPYGNLSFDFDQAYEHLDSVTKLNGERYAIPVDARGDSLMSFRQDIIKKNELGFENNTRFIPESRAEYQTLLEGLRSKADKGELWTRNINKGVDHSWYKVSASKFYPEHIEMNEKNALTALYANGGTLANDNETKIEFNGNEGFNKYLMQQADRYNNKLMGDGGLVIEMFGAGTTAIYPESPDYLTIQYSSYSSVEELTTVGKLGITEEDAADEIYSKPYIASHPKGWWTLEDGLPSRNSGKWYGSGHAISVLQTADNAKIPASLTFAKWFTQGIDIEDESKLNLAQWCTANYIPAWKNVYKSDDFKTKVEENSLLKSLGNPEDVMFMEPLQKRIIFTCFGEVISGVLRDIMMGNGDEETISSTISIIVARTEMVLY